MKFSFIFSTIFENRTFCTHTSICTKNVFLVILKSKYHSNIRFYFIIHRFIIIHFYTCHNASSLILWHFQRINQLYSIAKITFGSSTTEHFRLDSQVSNFKMKLFSSSDSFDILKLCPRFKCFINFRFTTPVFHFCQAQP